MQENKRPADRAAYEERLRNALKFLSYAPILFVSASTGKGTEKIFPTLEEVATERRKRVGTGEMNRFLKHVDFERASVPARQRVRIYYMTQAAVAPPTFVIFTDRKVKLHFAYQRFLENQIRKAFGFRGHADLDQEPGAGLIRDLWYSWRQIPTIGSRIAENRLVVPAARQMLRKLSMTPRDAGRVSS